MDIIAIVNDQTGEVVYSLKQYARELNAKKIANQVEIVQTIIDDEPEIYLAHFNGFKHFMESTRYSVIYSSKTL